MIVSSEKEERSNSIRYFALFLLILSGFVLNFFAPRLFMGFNYLFGSIPVIIVLRFYGLWWGMLAGVIAASWTYSLFGHPYAMVWLTVEPLFIGLGLRYSSTRNLVLLNTLYWPAAGIPLLWIFFKFVMGLPFVGTLPAALMFWLIGITNSLAATIIIQFTPLTKFIGEKESFRILTMKQATFSIMLSLVVFPAIIVMVINGRAIMARNEHNIINKVNDVANRYNQLVDLLLEPPILVWSNTGLEHIPDRKAQINIEYVKKYFSELEKEASFQWTTLLDSDDNIIFTNTPRFLNHRVYVPDKRNKSRPVQKGIDHVLPPMPEYITLWRRVQNSWYAYQSPYRNDLGWKWLIEIPFAPFQTSLLKQQTVSLQIVLFLCLTALAVSHLISHLFNRSIIELADISADIADKVEKDKPIIWPKSRLGEVKVLSDNFKKVADTLRLKFRQLRDAYSGMEEKVAERTLDLKASMEQAERLYRMMPSALFAVDKNRRITIWNKKAELITGYSAAEAIGRRCTFFSDGECYSNCIFDSGKTLPAEGIQCTIISKNNQKLTILKNVDVLIDGNGNVIGGMESFEDITQKMIIEEQLRQAQKMESIGTLASGIAHDFNNILFPIIGYTEILMDDIAPENEKTNETLKQIYSSALRARDLVRQILTFSRQDNFEIKSLEVQLIIKEVIKLLEATIPKKIQIEHDIDPNCRRITADPTQIHQIIMNLTTNAWHAMRGKPSGKLRVALYEEFPPLSNSTRKGPDPRADGHVCLSVSDTGSGIPPDLIDKIFDPFFTTKEKGKGTGMGLSVIHGIVESLNGHIKVKSIPDAGTEFKVYLPIGSDEAGLDEHPAPIVRGVQHGTERILAVDDETAILSLLKNSLEKVGYKVTPEINPADALERFRTNPGDFDLVITDMSMPKMSGEELASEMLSICPSIPIILCTGYSENFTPEMALNMGIKDYIAKPVIIKELTDKIRRILDKPVISSC